MTKKDKTSGKKDKKRKDKKAKKHLKDAQKKPEWEHNSDQPRHGGQKLIEDDDMASDHDEDFV